MEIPLNFENVSVGVLALVVLYLVADKLINNQSKEISGNQGLMQALIALLAQSGQTNDRISQSTAGIRETLEELRELKKSEHVLIVETHQNVKGFPSHLTSTKTELTESVNAAILRIESPLTVLLGAMNEVLPQIKEMHKFYYGEKAALEKRISILRRVKVEDTHEGEQPTAGEGSATLSGDSAEAVSK